MNNLSKPRASRWQRLVMPALTLALVAGVGQLANALAATNTLYLRGTGVPYAALSVAAPSSGTIPNFDPGRDDMPGLLVAKGGATHGETDPTKFQQWTASAGPLELDGTVTFTFWSAMKDFTTNKKGSIRILLLDCASDGGDCSEIETTQSVRNPWSGSGDWVQRTADFGSITHSIATDRALAVQLVVTEQSHDDMWFAYDTASYPSSLQVETSSPPPTTTTTTTTTTTVPPPSTTTSAPPATTTTTTTTAPPASTTTTTTTAPPAVTTTTSGPPATTTTLPDSPTTTSTTTTTAVPAGATTTTTLPVAGASTSPPTTLPPSQLPLEEDVALRPLPTAISSTANHQTLSGMLLDGLELVIPPAVASSLLSPLLLLEAIVGAFTDTGRDLVVPGMLLVIGVLWTEDRRRRDPAASLEKAIAGAQS